MSGKLYGVWEELPADLGDEVLHDDIPAGPSDDTDTATATSEDEAPEVQP